MNSTEPQEASTDLIQAGVDIVQMEFPDLDGALRGKFYSAHKVKPGTRGGISMVVYQFTPADDVWMSEICSYENGFPDLIAVPDLDTTAVLPWREHQASVIYDVEHHDGRPFALSPRNVLKKVEKRCADAGFEAKFGVEFECFVLHADDELIANGKHDQLAPLGRIPNAYRLNQADEMRELAAEFMRRMAGIGISVEVFHTELGNGAVEFALAPESPVKAADNAARAKTYFRELCHERGLVVTFMAKWDTAQSGCGGHIHQSLWKNGKNAFYDPDTGDLSGIAKQYIAGMLETMASASVIFRPVVNSYRRIDVTAWAPEDASWGVDNRCAAIRAIKFPSPSAYRVEHRIPGADANTYLSIATMLAGGLHGIENKLEIASPAKGHGNAGDDFAPLPDTLPDATEAFRTSDFCKEFLGEEFVNHYAKSRDMEWQHWVEWQKKTITAFELERYFETI